MGGAARAARLGGIAVAVAGGGGVIEGVGVEDGAGVEVGGTVLVAVRRTGEVHNASVGMVVLVAVGALLTG